MHYSVLMSVYWNESPAFLKSAIDSVLQQTVKTDDFLIVWDGKLTLELEHVLEEYQCNYLDIIRFLKIETNVGLGEALRRGVMECKNSLIARMDSDDIAVPERMEWQLEAFCKKPELALCGGQIEEFSINSDFPENSRIVPCKYEEILIYAKKRNPMNHMTVMFRKQAVLEAGNYLTMDYAEDYYLWVRMLVKDFYLINLPQILVKARVGNGMIRRRGGVHYAVSLTKLMSRFLRMGFLSKREYLVNICIRIMISLLPSNLRKVVYHKKLREKREDF